MLDVARGCPLQVTDHVGWHSENPSDFVYLELPRFKELSVFWRDADFHKVHPFLQKHHPMAPAKAGIRFIDAGPEVFGGCFRKFPGVFNDATQVRAVAKESSPELF